VNISVGSLGSDTLALSPNLTPREVGMIPIPRAA